MLNVRPIARGRFGGTPLSGAGSELLIKEATPQLTVHVVNTVLPYTLDFKSQKKIITRGSIAANCKVINN